MTHVPTPQPSHSTLSPSVPSRSQLGTPIARLVVHSRMQDDLVGLVEIVRPKPARLETYLNTLLSSHPRRLHQATTGAQLPQLARRTTCGRLLQQAAGDLTLPTEVIGFDGGAETAALHKLGRKGGSRPILGGSSRLRSTWPAFKGGLIRLLTF